MRKLLFHLSRLLLLPVLEKLNQYLYMRFYISLLKFLGVKVYGFPKYISRSVYFDGSNYSSIIIHDNVVISREVILLTHDYSLNVRRIALGQNVKIGDEEDVSVGTIEIGENSFIGARSLILGGVCIGNCTIVGAGSVVTSDIPSRVVCAGVPCKVIKSIV